MSTATIHRLPVTPAALPSCTASAEEAAAAGGYLFCDLHAGHSGQWHHDPVDGEWQVVQRRTGELIA